jgi:hypothetical protein
LGYIILWIALSFVAAAIAAGKGRSGLGFLILSLVFSPLVGVTAAVVAHPNERALDEERLSTGKFKKCVHCAEVIKSEARVCKYCGRDVDGESPTRAS